MKLVMKMTKNNKKNQLKYFEDEPKVNTKQVYEDIQVELVVPITKIK